MNADHRICVFVTFPSTFTAVTQIHCTETATPEILLMKDLGCTCSACLFLTSKINYCYSFSSDLYWFWVFTCTPSVSNCKLWGKIILYSQVACSVLNSYAFSILLYWCLMGFVECVLKVIWSLPNPSYSKNRLTDSSEAAIFTWQVMTVNVREMFVLIN